MAHKQSCSHFFQGCISSPFANAVNRNLYLPRAAFDTSKSIGHGKAEIVMAMRGEDHLLHARKLFQHSEGGGVFRRGDVSDRIWNVDGARARLDRHGDHGAK